MKEQEKIRPLRREDKGPIKQLLVDTGVFTDDEVAIALELVDIVMESPGQRDYIINVFDIGGEVLGYYCIGPTPATEGTFDLYWIAVKPTVHGRGVGGKLDLHAESVIRSRGGRLMIAETSSRPKYDKTRKFYSTHGYLELSRIHDYYRVGDDLVVFGRYLSQ